MEQQKATLPECALETPAIDTQPRIKHGKRTVEYLWPIAPVVPLDSLDGPGEVCVGLWIYHDSNRKRFWTSVHPVEVYETFSRMSISLMAGQAWSMTESVARYSDKALAAFAVKALAAFREAVRSWQQGHRRAVLCKNGGLVMSMLRSGGERDNEREASCDCCGRRLSFGCGHSTGQRSAARRHNASAAHCEERCRHYTAAPISGWYPAQHSAEFVAWRALVESRRADAANGGE